VVDNRSANSAALTLNVDHICCPHAHAKRAPARRAWSAARPARAACAALRLLTDVADSILVISGSGRRWSSGDRGERDDDDAAAAPAALARNQLRGHRQQIGKSAALTEGPLGAASRARNREKNG
jgi:hypothetical protein